MSAADLLTQFIAKLDEQRGILATECGLLEAHEAAIMANETRAVRLYLREWRHDQLWEAVNQMSDARRSLAQARKLAGGACSQVEQYISVLRGLVQELGGDA